MPRSLAILVAGAFLCALSYAQDAQDAQSAAPQPSLGEIARQLKLKKQQRDAELQAKAKQAPAQDAQTTDATADAQPQPKGAHLVTNDQTPERATVTPAASHPTTSAASKPEPNTGESGADAENWKSQIIAEKSEIAALQQDISTISKSIHFAGGNCVANCAEWNERQQQKKQEVDTMKSQLEEAQKMLKDLQESARQQGFGKPVYDP